MKLILISIATALTGFFFGVMAGGDFMGLGLGMIGLVSPSMFILDQIYRGKSKVRNTDPLHELTILENLRDGGILAEEEFEGAVSRLSLKEEEEDNTSKYFEALETLYEMSSQNLISQSQYLDKVRRLKVLYNQPEER